MILRSIQLLVSELGIIEARGEGGCEVEAFTTFSTFRWTG